MVSSIPKLSVECAAAAPDAAPAPTHAPAAVAPGAAPAPVSAPAATTALHSVFTSGSTRPRQESEVSKLKFLVDVLDVVKPAIANFVRSEGRVLPNVYHRNPSSIDYWGAWLETKPEEEWQVSNKKPKERAQLWICLGHDRCRNAMPAIKISNKQTSSDNNDSARSKVRAAQWQNKSEFQYLVYNMMQCSPFLGLSFRCQLYCRFRETEPLAAADMNLVICYLFVLLCFHAFSRNMAVRRHQQLATLQFWSMFVSFRSLAYLAARTAAVSDDLETARESNLFRTDPARYLAPKLV